jgi:DNA-binding winged helix-turn-helix (wHTH) protein/tetratricopeptide (TPR) repeat protein
MAEWGVAPVRLAHEPHFDLGPLKVRPSTREVLEGGQRRVLQPRTMQVLTALARKRGAVVARDELFATCWDGREVGGDSLNRCILAIRQLAEASPGAFSITTVPRVGYRLDEAAITVATQRPLAPRLTVARAGLTGRGQEMSALRELLGRAMSGHGGLVLFAGEPGVGKTRLAEEVGAEAARRGALVLTGRCYETAGAPPYAPFAELLEQAARSSAAPMLREALGQDAADVAWICPELRKAYDDIPPGAGLPIEPTRRYLFNALRDVLERLAMRRPLVLLLDDLHWADEATLDLLRHLSERLAQARLLVVGTHRNAEADVRGPFRDWWADVHRQRLGQQLVLRPLSEAAGVALIAELAGSRVAPALAESIYRATGGNAFFIEEMVRLLAQEGRLQGGEASAPEIAGFGVPEGVRLVVGKRLARLATDAQAVLTAAAVVGRPFTVELILAMGVGSEDAVLNATDAAQAAGLVIGEAGALRFTHELIRQTLVAGLSHARRQRMHLRVARAMEQVFGQRVKEHAADIGHHMLAAGSLADPDETAHYLLIAGHRSRGSAAFDEALLHFRAGLEAAPPGPGRIRARLLYACGLVHRSIGPAEAAEAALEGAIDISERLGEPEAGVHVYTALAAHLHWRCDFEGAGAVLERGLAAVGGRRDSARAELLTDRGCYHFLAGEFAQGDALLAEAEQLAFGEARPSGRFAIRRSLRAWCSAEWPDSVKLAQEACAATRITGATWALSEACGHLAISLLSQGRWAEVEAPLAEGEGLAFRIGHVWSQVPLLMSRAWLGLSRPNAVDEFERCADQLARLTEGSNFGLSFSRSQAWLGLAAWWGGRLEEAPAHFEAGVRAQLPALFTGEAWAASLLFRARTGDVSGAEALLGERPEFLRLPDEGVAFPLAAWDRISATAEALVVLGRHSEAAQFHETLQAYHGRGAVLRWLDGRLHQTVLAMTASAAGKWAEAEAGFTEALALAERLPHTIEQADTRRDWARALLRRNAAGDRERALELLTEAAERYHQLRMPSHFAAAKDQVAELT